MSRQKPNRTYILSWTLTITLSMFNFGYCLCILNPLSPFLFPSMTLLHPNSYFSTHPRLFQGVLTSAVPLGAGMGALTGGKLVGLGRRKMLMVMAGVFIIGWLWASFVYQFLILGRLFQGYASGVVSVIWPLFVNEVAPVDISGALGAMNQIMITLGILWSSIAGFFVPITTDEQILRNDHTWQLLFLVPAVVSVIQVSLLVFVFSYDSPTFYHQINKTNKYHKILSIIYPNTDLDEPEHQRPLKSIEKDTYCSLLNPSKRNAFMLGWGLSLTQQLTGI